MTKTKKQTIKTKNIKKTQYIPLNLSVRKFRNKRRDFTAEEQNLINFLTNKPTKEQLNKLYDTTIYFAESDSIGEGWNYVEDFTRKEFDILCKEISDNSKDKKQNYWNTAYIYIAYDLLHHLTVL